MPRDATRLCDDRLQQTPAALIRSLQLTELAAKAVRLRTTQGTAQAYQLQSLTARCLGFEFSSKRCHFCLQHKECYQLLFARSCDKQCIKRFKPSHHNALLKTLRGCSGLRRAGFLHLGEVTFVCPAVTKLSQTQFNIQRVLSRVYTASACASLAASSSRLAASCACKLSSLLCTSLVQFRNLLQLVVEILFSPWDQSTGNDKSPGSSPGPGPYNAFTNVVKHRTPDSNTCHMTDFHEVGLKPAMITCWLVQQVHTCQPGGVFNKLVFLRGPALREFALPFQKQCLLFFELGLICARRSINP